MIQTKSYYSLNPGRNLLITGAVHGNEPCGTIAINHIIKEIESGEIKILQGSVTFIPICNPEGSKQNVRLTQENLGRIFDVYENPTSYERKCSTVIAPYIDKSDAILDIHSGQDIYAKFAFQDHDTPEHQAITDNLGLSFIVHGRPDMYPDDGAKDISSYAFSQGKPGIVIECGQHQDPQAPEIAYNAILNFLHYHGIIQESGTKVQEMTHIKMKKLAYMLDKPGKFVKERKTFDQVKRGEMIAKYEDGEEVLSDIDGYIILPKHFAKPGDEWFYLGEKI